MPQLDALRAIAVLAVLYSHYLPEPRWFLGIYWGEAGVRLFFVLSGFLITKLLASARSRVEEGTHTRAQALGHFYARRALRLVPAYYAVLAVAAAIGIAPVRETLLWHLGYLSNTYFVRHGGWDGPVSHLWSLAVEEQFYLGWSLIIVLAASRRRILWIVAAILSGPLFRLVCLALRWPQIVSWVMTPGSLDALGLGALLAWRTRQGTRFESRGPFLGAAAACGLLGWIALQKWGTKGAWAGINEVLGTTVLSVFFVWLIGRAARGFGGFAGRLLESRPLLYLGKISYGVYLIHNFAVPLLDVLFAKLRIRSFVPVPALAVPTTIGLAALSWRFLERPCNRLKARFD